MSSPLWKCCRPYSAVSEVTCACSTGAGYFYFKVTTLSLASHALLTTLIIALYPLVRGKGHETSHITFEQSLIILIPYWGREQYSGFQSLLVDHQLDQILCFRETGSVMTASYYSWSCQNMNLEKVLFFSRFMKRKILNDPSVMLLNV